MNVRVNCRALFWIAALGLSTGFKNAMAGSVEQAPYGTTSNGTPVHIFTLQNNHGMRAQILDYGGIICDVEVPDRLGSFANVVFALKDLRSIETHGAMNALTGRYANRIKNGFTLEGKHYDLTMDQNGVTLHGGRPAYSSRVLSTLATFQTANSAAVTLGLISPDDDQGFPGTLRLSVTYTLTDNNDLSIAYRAVSDKATVVNLTNHTYFNMAGNGSGSVENELLTLMADQFTPTDTFQVPTGEIAPVAGTALDFRTPTPIGARIRSSEPQMLIGRGYDHNFVLRKSKPGALELAARLSDPRSGRTLELYTTEPGVQVYSSNNLNGTAVSAAGTTLRMGDGLALETQHFPDSPNHPNFPSTELKPGETFASETLMHFSVLP